MPFSFPCLFAALFLICATLFYGCCPVPVKAGTDRLSLERKIGQMILVGFHGTRIDDENLGELRDQIRAGEVAGIILFGHNIVDREQLARLQKGFTSLAPPVSLFVAVDQEGGRVARLNGKNGFEDFPPAREVAATKSPEEAYRLYRSLARMVREAGFNVNLAPVVDLDLVPDSPAIGKLGRSFSVDPGTVCRYAEAVVRAHREEGVLTALKHFPGHGSAAGDSHLGVTEITSSWVPAEWAPYRDLVARGMADAVMTGHLLHRGVDEQYPASLSARHVEENLRGRFGYGGVVITDDLQMGAVSQIFSLEEMVVQAVNSGSDLLLFSNFFRPDKEIPWKVKRILVEAVRSGRVRESRIDEAYGRVMDLKARLGERRPGTPGKN